MPDATARRIYRDHYANRKDPTWTISRHPKSSHPADWEMLGTKFAVNHVAVMPPSREAWLQQLALMRSKGVKFDRRVAHGMTHGVYIHDPNGYGIELLYEPPRDVWENDIDGALNYSVSLPTEGPEALADRTENLPGFGARG